MTNKLGSTLIVLASSLICSACFGQEEVHYPGKVELVHATKTEVHIFQLYEDRGICQFPTSDGTNVMFLTIDDWNSTVKSMITLPGSHMKQYLQILPEQEEQILELRAAAKKEFVKVIEGLHFCDDPRFPQVEAQVMQLSKKLNEQSQAILLPHQFEAWNEFLMSATAMQNGSVLNSVIEGSLSGFLGDKGREGVAELRPIVREILLEELQELEKKAVRELLRDESPETRDRIMKVYDALPPNWTPNFKALMSQEEGGLNGCANCPPATAEPKENLIGHGWFGNTLSAGVVRPTKQDDQPEKGDPKKNQSEKDGGDRPDKN